MIEIFEVYHLLNKFPEQVETLKSLIYYLLQTNKIKNIKIVLKYLNTLNCL